MIFYLDFIVLQTRIEDDHRFKIARLLEWMNHSVKTYSKASECNEKTKYSIFFANPLFRGFETIRLSNFIIAEGAREKDEFRSKKQSGKKIGPNFH